MHNIMIDLETMGNGPSAAIVAIGAVAFDLDAQTIGDEFYARVDLASSVEHGGSIDASTVMWWLTQSDAARNEIARAGGEHIAVALSNFSVWSASESAKRDMIVWGNGASFDNVILRGAYHRIDAKTPWDWWNDRCYRTVKAQNRHVRIERNGTHHNALDDARSQALHLLAIRAAGGAA